VRVAQAKKDDACTAEDTQGVAFALDWKATAASSLDVDVWYNDHDQDTSNEYLARLKRIQKPIDRAVNSFLQQWLGAPLMFVAVCLHVCACACTAAALQVARKPARVPQRLHAAFAPALNRSHSCWHHKTRWREHLVKGVCAAVQARRTTRGCSRCPTCRSRRASCA
jgi:hypothetical protein